MTESDNSPTVRNEFPGLYYVELECGEMKIVDSAEYYPAVLGEVNDSIEETAQELADAMNKAFRPMLKTLKALNNETGE